MKIDLHMQQQKCRPITLVSGNICRGLYPIRYFTPTELDMFCNLISMSFTAYCYCVMLPSGVINDDDDKIYADTRRGSCWRGLQMRVRWLTTAIFGDFSGYFFGNFRDKASSIMWRYATRCWPVTDCKMNDLE